MDFAFLQTFFILIFEQPLLIFILFISIIFLHSFETLLHECGHAFATLLAYIIFSIKEQKKISLKLKIDWKFKIPNLLNKDYTTNAGTHSEFRDYIINKPQYTNYYKFIILGGIVFGSIFMMLAFIITLFIPYSYLKIILCINELIWILLNIIYFFDAKDNKGSDYYKYKQLKHNTK